MKTLDLFLFGRYINPLVKYFFDKFGWDIYKIAWLFGLIFLTLGVVKNFFPYNVAINFSLYEEIYTRDEIDNLISFINYLRLVLENSVNFFLVLFLPIYARHKINQFATKGGKNPLYLKWRIHRLIFLGVIFFLAATNFSTGQLFLYSFFDFLSQIFFFFMICVLCADYFDEDEMGEGLHATA